MIRARAKTDDGRPLYIFGLSEENVKRLKAGRPIHFDLDTVGAVGDVMIFYGKTEQDMMKEFVGTITPATILKSGPED